VQLNVSNRSSFRKIRGQHLTTLAPQQAKVLEREITGLGGDCDRLSQYYFARWAFNIFAFPYFLKKREGGHQKFIPDWVGLFDDDILPVNDQETITHGDPVVDRYAVL
jgi:hypothetical protein